jgi:hypothetical protein
MNGRSQMQGGKNWILPKEISANRFSCDSHWLEIWRERDYGLRLWLPLFPFSLVVFPLFVCYDRFRCCALPARASSNDSKKSEPAFVNLLRGPGIDSQPGRPVRQPYLSYRPARLHRVSSLNVYKYGLWSFYILLIHEVRPTYRSFYFQN